MKSQRYQELKVLYETSLKLLHDRSHPAVVALYYEMYNEGHLCRRREVFLQRYKLGLQLSQPIKFKVIKSTPKI